MTDSVLIEIDMGNFWKTCSFLLESVIRLSVKNSFCAVLNNKLFEVGTLFFFLLMYTYLTK